MPEYIKPRPALILLEAYEKIIGWVYLPLFFLVLPTVLGIAAMLLHINVLSVRVQVLLNAGLELFSFVLLAVCFHRYLGRCFRQTRSFPGRYFVGLVVGIVIYYFGTALMSFLTQLIEPGLENINNATIEDMAGANVYTILLAPLVEELLVRGTIFTTLRPHSRFLAYAVSIAIFCLIHVMGYVGRYPLRILALCFVQYLPASFALAWALEYSGSIWTSISVHMVANTIAMAVMLLVQ